MRNQKLTNKQKLFAVEYKKDRNAYQAALRAGYSKSFATVHSHKMLVDVRIKAIIGDVTRKAAKRAEITLAAVLMELAKVGFVNTQALYDEAGNFIPIQDLPPDTAAAISGLEIEELRRGAGKLKKEKGSILKKVKMHSKVEALKELRKHFEGDRLTIGPDPEMVQLLYDLVEALPPAEAKRVWGVIGKRVELLKEKNP